MRGGTYEANEDTIVGLHGDLSAIIFRDHVIDRCLAVCTERASESDTLHAVAKKQGVTLF